MQIKYLIWSLIILIIGGVISFFVLPIFKRGISKKWRLYDAWPPFMISATAVLAASRQISSTASFILIDICALALIYAIYLAVVPRAINWRRFILIIWRCSLLISLFWYVFVFVWVLAV
ncbi:DUF3397 family protein [Lapidilactobacillus bayanensis]|uniref:DUF3397 family protein n=1 Tax=Lapidilactobacillus bayanensis TaxID=2485998 RepID=UPI000F7A04B3|nr:DUF3397 family protein [Lapidilactobacillus bayanensis]